MLNLQEIFSKEITMPLYIDHITYNSALVTTSSLFVALEGRKVDGHNYVAKAFANGAKVAIVQHLVTGCKGLQMVVPDSLLAMSKISQLLYETADLPMTMIGITGTDGKTSTATLIEQLLLLLGQKVGYIGTNGIRYLQQKVNLQCTTPLAPELHQILQQMRQAKIQTLAMEVSSHALATKRVEDLVYDYAVFTNFSHDHLDFHHTLEDYATAKKHLFSLLKPEGKAIINADDAMGQTIIKEISHKTTILTYGFAKTADFYADSITYSMVGMQFILHHKHQSYSIQTQLIGTFNISNLLAAIAILFDMGINIATVIPLIGKLTPVEGRMEFFHHHVRGISAIVDFAHAPNAILQVIAAARLLTTGRIIVVTGAVGDGDIEKRPLMGEICLVKADHTIFTTDQPYSESPQEIINQMLTTASQKTNFSIILDRQMAILSALELAHPMDIVLVLGKGRETKICYADYEITFSDYQFVKEYMEKD
ncbi:MAG: UDP-N-acetylmuramoyl-L-alanyl-D-glutamate--2,6-diaminopimelate ligase [Culicoidibacterales bacterium]